MMLFKSKINFYLAVLVLSILGIVNNILLPYSHKHNSKNLHFHSENVITADHTEKADLDCFICDLIFSATYTIHENKNSSIYELIKKDYFISTNIVYPFIHKFLQPGRSPPTA